MRVPALAVSTVLAGLLAGCAPDGPVAPTLNEPPRFLIGEVPTSRLFGGSPNSLYDTYAGGILISLSLSRGVFTASRRGGTSFVLETRLALANDAGQTRVIDPKTDDLTDLKVEFNDPQSQFVGVSFSVPWDGLDEAGRPITGDATLSYQFQLLHATGGVDNPDYRPVGPALVGSLNLFLDDGTP